MLTRAAAFFGASGFGAWAAGDPLAYPVANVVHLIGLVLLVGSAWAMDVAVLCAGRPELRAGLHAGLGAGLGRLAPLLRAGRRAAIAGLALMLPSGLLMFAADAEALAGSSVFRWKLLVVAAALLNAAAFQLGAARRSPSVTRAMALGSIIAWLTVLILGRWIAYA